MNPGDYAVKVAVGGRELTGTVTVRLDPQVQASAADLDAQLQGAFAALALQTRVNAVLERVDSIVTQLTAIDAPAGAAAAGAGVSGAGDEDARRREGVP